MTDFAYTLYDTAEFDDAADVEHTLFQVGQGADATHNKGFTNARGGGSMPGEERFEVKSIDVWLDADAIAADRENMWLASYLEFEVSDKTVLIAPLSQFAKNNSFGGFVGQAAAADEALIGRTGNGYHLEIPIILEGGNSFRVVVFQGTALATDPTNVKVALNGVLSRP